MVAALQLRSWAGCQLGTAAGIACCSCLARACCTPCLTRPLLQVAHRSLSVSLAGSLLMNLPEAFKHSTFLAAASKPVPAAAAMQGLVAAPWSAVCLAAMLQRSSDKAAAVRAKALAELADIVTKFTGLLELDVNSLEYSMAESFALGLCAAGRVQVRIGVGAGCVGCVCTWLWGAWVNARGWAVNCTTARHNLGMW